MANNLPLLEVAVIAYAVSIPAGAFVAWIIHVSHPQFIVLDLGRNNVLEFPKGNRNGDDGRRSLRRAS
jgi:hypothetical protein